MDIFENIFWGKRKKRNRCFEMSENMFVVILNTNWGRDDVFRIEAKKLVCAILRKFIFG